MDDTEKQVKNPYRALDGSPFTPRWALGLQTVYGVSASGDTSANSLPYRTDALIFPVIEQRPDTRVELELGTDRKLELDHGAGVILGRANSGKTLMMDTIVARNGGNAALIRYREPERDSLLYEHQLVAALVAHLESSQEIICIDSLRTTFYAGGGSTGKGGVNMGIFELITAYDLIAKQFGKLILFALNPTTNDQDAIEYYLEAATGSVAHTFHATAPKAAALSSRTGRSRNWAKLTYAPPDVRAAEHKAKSVTHLRLSEAGIADLYTFTDNR